MTESGQVDGDEVAAFAGSRRRREIGGKSTAWSGTDFGQFDRQQIHLVTAVMFVDVGQQRQFVGLDRQEHREGRPIPRLRPDFDRPAVVLDDALADRQPQPCPLLLGREERDEQDLEVARGDTDARVAEPHLQEGQRPG